MKKLYRSRIDKIIGGVAAGMADYFGLDVALVRLLWLLFVFMGGIGLPVYIVAWIIIPEEPYYGAAKDYSRGYPENQEPGRYQELGSAGSDNESKPQGERKVDAENYSQERTNQALGLLLVIIGLVFLVRETLSWDIFRYVWPTLFLVLGVYILFSSRRG